jgi:peptidoglycan/LPS O-acetylase OafA/YrhL
MQRIHLAYLDGCRALAIAGVVLTHSIWLVASAPSWAQNVAHFGSKGVQLFFLVSGMTLALNYDSAGFDAREFFVRRFFRIAPMYYLAALAYVALGATLIPSVLPDDLAPASWLATFTFTNGWMPATINSFVPGGWSIAAEATFYLLFPLLLLLKQRRAWIAALACLSLPVSVASYHMLAARFPGDGDDASFAYFFWLTQLPAFLLGVCAAALLPALERFRSQAAWIFPVVSLLICLAALSRGVTSSYIVADVLFFAFVLSGAIGGSRFLGAGVLRRLGQISFSVYLVHFAVVALAREPTRWLAATIGDAPALWIGYASVLGVSAAVATATYEYIEKPGIALGRRLTSQRLARRQLRHG